MLYLIVLTVVLLFPPIVKISGMTGGMDGVSIEWSSYSLLFSSAYLRSLMVIWISLVFLLWWNFSTNFKGFVVNLFSLREDEPLVDFAFLWVITSVFMGIADTVGVAHVISERITITSWAILSQILLLAGLIWSFVSLWVSAKKSSKKAKILNIVDEPLTNKHIEISNQKPKKQLNHLFDDIDE